MSSTTTNMGLTAWDSPSDFFNNTQLADNWDAIDTHDHTTGNGVQIPSGGIATGAITNAKLGANAVSSAKLGANSVLTASIADDQVTAAKLANLPAARVYNSTDFSVSNNTPAQVPFDSERTDTETIHSTSSQTTRLTCRTSGHYLIWGGVSWAANGTGERLVTIYLNGSTTIASSKVAPTSGGGTTDHIVSCIYLLSVAGPDYVELRVNQTSGGALLVKNAPNFSPEFGMVRIA